MTKNDLSKLLGLTDLTAVSVLLNWIPAAAVEEALAAAGCETYRLRALPMELMMFFVVATGLFREESNTDVMRLFMEGVRWMFGGEEFSVPSKSSIHAARKKLGAQPVQNLFSAICRPVAPPKLKGSFFKGWRMVAVDGCLINMVDTAENSEEFGRPTNQSETKAYPQIRMVCLAECGSHVIFGTAFGGANDSEIPLAKQLLPQLDSSMICLMDRLFFGFDIWQAADATGAKLLWRVKSSINFEPYKRLEDGSFIAKYSTSKRSEPFLIRVIEYEVGSGQTKQKVRLVTNILDPNAAPADQLARLYTQRWEIELVYGEVKTRLNANEILLRSGSPDLVRQELLGLLLAHFCIRSAITEAATKYVRYEDPDDYSFTAALKIIRRRISGAGDFSP
jgi:hypothetical protein